MKESSEPQPQATEVTNGFKYKLIFGLFGCSSEGVLNTPNDKYRIKLPKRFAFFIHTFLNQHIAYAGLDGTKLIWPGTKNSNYQNSIGI